MHSVLITAANSGLGIPTVLELLRRGYHVTATTRSEAGEDRIRKATKDSHTNRLTIEYLDLSHENLPPSIIAALHTVDGLINNAGMEADLPQSRGGANGSVLTMDWEDFQKALWINANGARRLMQQCIPEMKKRNFGRVVNVSSARASLGHILADVSAPCYDLSKTVLNAVTAHIGHELRGTNVLVNSLCPGWCATTMGGINAPDTPEQGAARIVRLLDLPDNGPNGKFFINNQEVPF